MKPENPCEGAMAILQDLLVNDKPEEVKDNDVEEIDDFNMDDESNDSDDSDEEVVEY